jgi:hypothetical protein
MRWVLTHDLQLVDVQCGMDISPVLPKPPWFRIDGGRVVVSCSSGVEWHSKIN